MTNQYQVDSERTEKKFPEGMLLSGDHQTILQFLHQDQRTIAEAVDHMKKHLIYGAECEIQPMRSSEFAPGDKQLDSMQAELLHAAMGMLTEAEEFFDAVLMSILKGRDLDGTNLMEEIGDLMWYQSIAARLFLKDFKDIQHTNIQKLKDRYPDAYSDDNALNRDLDTERTTLEDTLASAVGMEEDHY